MYEEVKELLPDDVEMSIGNYVRLTHYSDASLFHYQLNGRSVTRILHLVNKTPAGWYSKKQSTVETATYGYGFFSVRICIE